MSKELTVNQIEYLLKRIEDTKVRVGALIEELDGVCLFCGETISVYADKCPRCGNMSM